MSKPADTSGSATAAAPLAPHAAPAQVEHDTTASELRVVLGQLTRRLREQGNGGSDYTHSQGSALLRLEREGPQTISDLARAEGVRPQSMAAIVQFLLEAGYIEGSPDPKDGRKTLLSITDEARAKFASGRLAKEDWLFRTIRTTFTDDERQALATSIPLLRRLATSP
ncbi:MarR family winged helix-turn-helix transcriptional regulator [Subtercola endophyticus]|uniref:MarR family winged helix-turn-helix transcriptional regulator n=1 Tax=Subtercola endophyticus TaxID=2895559 RepID=UPI001E5EF5CD|nr:MarR family transcriptional regulator [Subtercola endophyticus]UFS58459.1 MarR family transcriptional regulator [Subtercola endophyticus]